MQRGVTNKNYLRAADTNFCIRDITSKYIVAEKLRKTLHNSLPLLDNLVFFSNEPPDQSFIL